VAVPMDSGLSLPPADFVRVDSSDNLAAANHRLRRFWDYAESCRSDGGLPQRRRFDPIDIPALLPHIWIIDADVDTGRLSYRLVGTRVVAAIGFDPTGRDLAEIMAERIARIPGLLDRYWFSARTGKATWRRGPARHWRNMEYAEVENLCVPFEDPRDSGIQMIGISVCYRADGTEY
jgi:hypothetical protein